MKINFKNLWFLSNVALSFIIALLPLSSFASWDAGEIDKTNQWVRVSFSPQLVDQGIVLQRTEKKNKDVYLMSLFADKAVYKTVVVTKKIFYEQYQSLRQAFFNGIQERNLKVTCTFGVHIERKIGRSPASENTLCEDDLSKKAHKSIDGWYTGAKRLIDTF